MIMRQCVTTLLLLLFPLLCHAQGSVGYSYDAAGNRISRTIILSRNMAKKQARAVKDKEYTDILSQRNISISPNPTKGMVKITITGLRESDDCAMSVYTLKGQTLKKLSVSGEVTTIDLSGQPDGIYLLDITINGEKTSWKIIKK